MFLSVKGLNAPVYELKIVSFDSCIGLVATDI